MEIIRHTSLAVLVILVILIVLLTPAVETAPEIVVPPSSVTVFSGNTAEFTCQTRNADYTIWILNGIILTNYDATLSLRMDVDNDQESVESDITSYILTIRARTEYHGLVFQCVAGIIGGPVVESENATLMVQGLLDPVSDVMVESGTGSILLSWRPPYSLNVTGMEPDILYTVNISNMTDETPVPCSDCHNLTQPHYTFITTNPSPCHKYNFTIMSQNGAGEGGRSEPVEIAFAGLFASNAREVTVNRTVEQGMQTLFLICSQNCYAGNETVVLYFNNTEGMKECEMNATDEISLNDSVLTLPNNLSFDCKWNLTIETRTALDRVNTTGEIAINTFEVMDASASPPTPPIPGVLSFTGNFTKYAGGCFIVVPDGSGLGEDICILVKLQDIKSSATLNVTGFSRGIRTPRIYDLDKDGKVGERPAVIISSVIVAEGDNQPVQSSGVLIERASDTTINITLNKSDERSIHADELMVVWYDRDDVILNSRIYFVNSTVDQIAIRISEEKNYTVAVFCNNSMYPWAIETFEAIYKQAVNPTPSETVIVERKKEVQKIHSTSFTIILVIAGIIIIAITIGLSVICVLWRRKKAKQSSILLLSTEDKEKGKIVDDGCGSYSNPSMTTSPPAEKDLDHTKAIIYSELGPIPVMSVRPLTGIEPPSQYTTIDFLNMPSTDPVKASVTQLTEPVIPEKPKMVPISLENVKAMLRPVAKKWKEIGDALEIRDHILDEVDTNNATDECCMDNAVEFWVTYHGPSWEKLATVLRGVGEETLANKCQVHRDQELQNTSATQVQQTIPQEETHHDVNDAPSDVAPELPPRYVHRDQEIQKTSATQVQQTIPQEENKCFTNEGNIEAENASQQDMECGKPMHIVEAKDGKLICTADDYTPPPNDNDEEPNRRVDLIENTVDMSSESYIRSSNRFASVASNDSISDSRPGNEKVNMESRGYLCNMSTKSPCVSVSKSYSNPSQLVVSNTFFNAQSTVLPPNEITPSAQVHAPEQQSCGPIMQVTEDEMTEEEMPPTAKYCFTPFTQKELESGPQNDPKSDTDEFDYIQSSESRVPGDEDAQETESSVPEMKDAQETESSVPEMEDVQETESSTPEIEGGQEAESSLPKMEGDQEKISDDMSDVTGPQFLKSFATDHMLGLVAIAQTVWSAMKIFICKYAPWDRGRTVLSCLWRDTGRNGYCYIQYN